jgi:hypothetical protein
VPVAAGSDVGLGSDDNSGPIKAARAEQKDVQVTQTAQTSVYPILSSRKQKGNLTVFAPGDIFTKARYYRARYCRIEKDLGGRRAAWISAPNLKEPEREKVRWRK